MWGFTSTKHETKAWDAHVLDAANATAAGGVQVISHGETGWGMIFLVAIPPPPFPVLALTGTEWHACSSLGEALADLLAGVPPAQQRLAESATDAAGPR